MGLIDQAWLDAHPPDPKVSRNPMIRVYGPALDGLTCKTCAHLFKSGQWWKCGLRRNTGGPATDHRVRWPACGKHKQMEE